jgi:hypothetical protein
MSFTTTYFLDLASASKKVLDNLPIEKKIKPLNETLNKLRAKIELSKEDNIVDFKSIPAKINKVENNFLSPGLNTIGMLTDRFTILLLKEWSLRNKNINSDDKANQLFKTETMEIIDALSQSKPGFSSINSKVTSIKANAIANSWEEAFYGILSTNLLLWESQEVLYLKDISELPSEEIREYVKWFSFGNILRNEFMQLCDKYFWQKYKIIDEANSSNNWRRD